MTPSNPREWRRAIPIDRYATILAHVLHFGPAERAAVVERFGLDEAGWEAVDAIWCAELNEVVRRHQVDLSLRFASAFARARMRLAREQPAVDRVGDAAPRKLEVEPPAPPAATPPVQPLVPSYKLEERPGPDLTSWQPPPAVIVPAAPVEDVAGTADVSAFVPRGALPFQASTGPSPVAQHAVPHPPEATPPGSGTEDITAFVARAATPFGDSPSPAAQPRMRLLRFDPQTGQPLAEPRWEEIPPDPPKR